MLTLNDPELAARARRLREHGMSVSAADRHASAKVILEEYLETGFNYRMTDLQAALGLVQLTRLDGIIARRRELAARYRELLAEVPGLVTAADPGHGTTNYHSFWILLPQGFPVERAALLRRPFAGGIPARRATMAAHREPAYAPSSGRPDHPDLPATDWFTTRSLILPLFHEMTPAEQEQVVHVIVKA